MKSPTGKMLRWARGLSDDVIETVLWCNDNRRNPNFGVQLFFSDAVYDAVTAERDRRAKIRSDSSRHSLPPSKTNLTT